MKISRAALNHLYASAYHSGHHDTVEGQYTHVYPEDLETYHNEDVEQWLKDEGLVD